MSVILTWQFFLNPEPFCAKKTLALFCNENCLANKVHPMGWMAAFNRLIM